MLLKDALRFALRANEVDQNLLRFFGKGLRAFVAHLGQLFDGALFDLFVFGPEELAPNLKEVDARVDFLDEVRGILGQWFVARRMRLRAFLAACFIKNFAWDARLL